MKRLCAGIGIVAALALLHPASAAAQVSGGHSLAFEVYSHEYEEEVGGTFFMSNKGPFVSARYAYVWKFDSKFIEVSPSVALGSVDYESAGTGTIDGTFNSTVILEVRGGNEFQVAEGVFVIPWVGLGYRNHYDAKGGEISSTGAAGYDRVSEYWYLPVGVTMSVPMGGAWMLEPAASYRFFLGGTQTSYISDVSPTCTDLKNDQNDGYGFEASLGFRTALNGSNLTFGPFFRYWDIDDSDIGYFACGGTLFAGIEPKNTTTEIGVRLRLGF